MHSLRTFSISFGFLAFFFWLIVRTIDRALAKEYQVEYTTYGLDPNLGKAKRLYLRYMLFLDKLVDKKYSREDIAKLRCVAILTEPPRRPPTQFADHPIFWLLFAVPFMGGLWTLSADFIKQSDFWKVKQAALSILAGGVFVVIALVAGFYAWDRIVTIRRRTEQYQEIQRFLQWAESDIEEAQSLKARRLRMELPGAHGRYR
jgi:hypothetical protein